MSMKSISIPILLIIQIFSAKFFLVALRSQGETYEISSNTESKLEIEGIKFIDPNGNVFCSSELIDEYITALFIFSGKCPKCDPNIFLWEKIVRSHKNKFKTLGIILSTDDELKRFHLIKKLNFNIFKPLSKSDFKQIFKIKNSLSMTLLLKNKRIIFCKTGNIDVDDYLKMIKIIKGDSK